MGFKPAYKLTVGFDFTSPGQSEEDSRGVL